MDKTLQVQLQIHQNTDEISNALKMLASGRKKHNIIVWLIAHINVWEPKV